MKHSFPKKYIAFSLGALLFLALLPGLHACVFQKVCGAVFLDEIRRDVVSIETSGGKLGAEVVDTPASREQGLSGRKALYEEKGMLFVFDHPGKYGFWMKDMLFSIDIIWISEEGTVVHVERNVTPESYSQHNPPKTFVNKPDAKYVLEVSAGTSEKYGLYLGTKVKIGE